MRKKQWWRGSVIIFGVASSIVLNTPQSNAQLTTFQFKTVTVDLYGKIIQQETKTAQQYTENLGNGVTLEMVAIPSGTFMMGAPADEDWSGEEERPVHEVSIAPFFMSKYEITEAQFWQVMSYGDPSEFKGTQLPVDVSWQDVLEFLQRLSKFTGKTYRLATEAEWEYACRAGTTTPFAYGPTITTALATYNGQRYALEPEGEKGGLADVGSFPPNAFGLYDMHGNLYEWVADTYSETYKGAPTDGSMWGNLNDSNIRVLRGGSYDSDPNECRCASRLAHDLEGHYYSLPFGLRVVRGQ